MKYGLGWKRDRLDFRDRTLCLSHAPDFAPASDLRSLMPPVYDQGQTNSCVANATAAAFEFVRKAQGLPDWTPSRLFIYWQARSYEGATTSDSGSEIRDGVKAVANIGAVPEWDWPFDPANINVEPTSTLFTEAQHAKLIQYATVPQTLGSITNCLVHHGPVIFGSSVFAAIESEEVAKTGVIPFPSPTDDPAGGHAMLLVGYQPEQRRFIIRNSWGSGWGDAGYGYMPEAYILNPGLTNDIWVAWAASKN
jgi:C1A family cysteine protease